MRALNHMPGRGAALLALLLLTGCGERAGLGLPQVSRDALPAFGQNMLGAVGLGRKADTATADPAAQPSGAALDVVQADGSRSDIIDGLLARRSALTPGAFATVSGAVMAANSRAAEADLRAAILRSEATSKNWLPSLGPQISLNSLGSVVADLVVEQVVFDNGRKKAERAIARADVEVAAVALAQDSNGRVLTALDLYLTSRAAQARAEVTGGAIGRMERFEYVMSERVRGGINDRSDLLVVRQKLDQMRSDLANDREAATAAANELAAMSATRLGAVSGLSTIDDSTGLVPLSVLKAQAEARRAAETARAARAGFLPGLTATGRVGKGGTDGGLSLAIPNGLGFGSGASMRALEAEEAAAAARVTEASEVSARKVAKFQGEVASLRRELAQTQGLAQQARRNFELFDAQLRAGRKSVPDVIGVFETSVKLQRRAADLAYDVARAEVKLAAHRGALVAGGEI